VLRRAVPVAVALATATLVVSTFASAATPPRAGRVLHVAPALGLAGVAVRFSGADVPRHLTILVYFDVTTRDKRLVCVARNGTSTRWGCTGRIPRAYGALGPHTVEMDASTPTGRGGFEELATFLVTDLGVTVASPASTAPGDTVQLRVTASNGDPTTASDVVVRDQLPAGLRFERATAPCHARAGLIRCGPFRMGPHTSRVLVFTARVTATRPTHLGDRVVLTGHPDPIASNDVVRLAIRVT
jgi:uncharacterized repeat protein (TIGR01451 family)